MDPESLDASRIEALLGGNGLAARLANASSDPIAITRLEDGVFLWVNDALCKSSGVAREELLGHRDDQFGFYLDPQVRVEILEALRRDGRFGPKVGKFRGRDGRDAYAETTCTLVELDGEYCVIAVTRPMTEQVETLHLLQRRDTILQAAAYAAQRFLLPGTFEQQMSEALERIGQAAAADRVFVYENSGGDGEPLRMSVRYEWAAEGMTLAADDPENIDYPYDPTFSRWREVLSAGDAIHGAMIDLPEQERRVLSPTDEGSITAVPVFIDAHWWGFVGVYHTRSERAPSAAEAEAMKVVAASLGTVLARQEAEARAFEAELSFRTLVEQLPGAIYIEGLPTQDKVTSYLSPGYTRMFGVELEETVPSLELWKQVLHPDDFDRVVQASERSDETLEPFELEYRVRTADSQVLWVQDRAVVVRDADGAPKFWLGLVIDITARVTAEEELRATEAKLRALIEQIPFATYVQSPEDPDNFYISPQIEQVTGYPFERFDTIGFWDAIIHPDDFATVLAESDRTDETGEVFDMEYRILDAGEQIRWIHETATLVPSVGGGEGVWQGVFEDITERKAAEVQLREAEERYRMLVERAPAVTYQEVVHRGTYPSAAMLYMSPQAADILGYSREDLERDPALFWDRVIHPDDLDEVVQTSVGATRDKGVYRDEYRVIRADGTTAWVHDEAALWRVEEDGTQYWHGFITDITDRKQAEEELERALALERDAVERLQALDELKNTFLNAVSHDLRTPLAAIHGLALTLERDDIELEPHETRDLAKRIAANSRKLDRLVTDLLDLDRLSRGIVEAKRSHTDLSLLVRKVVEEADFMEAHPVRVEAEPVSVFVDPPKVERIVENLLANIVRHTPVGTQVWVRVFQQEQGAVLAVEDEGPGVPPAMKEAIFEPFRQGDSPSRHSPGVGVGLSLVAAFAGLHGGRAWVEDREGGGASFRVLFPVPPD